MTDSIKDILGGTNFEPPDEIAQIKKFVQDSFGEQPRVKIAKENIIITVSNAALAGSLRYQLHNLQNELKTTKKLLIRIG